MIRPWKFLLSPLRIFTAVVFFNMLVPAQALEIDSSSDALTRGSVAEFDVSFYSRWEMDSGHLTLKWDGYSVTIAANETGHTVLVRGQEPVTGDIAYLTESDAVKLQKVLEKLLPQDLKSLASGAFLLRGINLLAAWPPGMPLDLYRYDGMELFQNNGAGVAPPQTPMAQLNSACDWLPPPIDLSQSLCSEMNLTHAGDYIRLGTEIWQLPFPPYSPIYLPLWCSNFNAVVGPHPYPLGECQGRCGKGCIGDGIPDNGLDIFTQNCFNHDKCVEVRGYFDDYCNQMFLYTINDFLFGTPCGL